MQTYDYNHGVLLAGSRREKVLSRNLPAGLRRMTRRRTPYAVPESVQVSVFMVPPRRYSVSPLHSFASLPPAVRQASFSETLAILWRWARGDRPSLRQTFAEERLIEKLADEMGDEPEPTVRDAKLHLSPTAKAKR